MDTDTDPVPGWLARYAPGEVRAWAAFFCPARDTLSRATVAMFLRAHASGDYDDTAVTRFRRGLLEAELAAARSPA